MDSSDNDARLRLQRLLTGFFPAQLLQTIAQLGVADALGEETVRLDVLAERTGTHAPSLERLLRAAIGVGVVLARPCGGYALTEDGRLLRSDVDGSMGNVAMLYCGEEMWRSWGALAHSVRTGEPSFEKITGRTTFEHLAGDPRMLAVFTEAMAEGVRATAPGIVASCDLTGVRTLADVGGGNGTLLAAFLAAHPDLRGVLLDTADGVGTADGVLRAAGVADRCEVLAGDFFEAVPAADAHIVKSVLHDWDDARCVDILTTVRAAMPPRGTLFVIEPTLPDDPAELHREQVTLMNDLTMLVGTGGRERTVTDFEKLLAAAGLRLVSRTPVPAPLPFTVLRAVQA